MAGSRTLSWRTSPPTHSWDAEQAAKLKLPHFLKPFTHALEVVEQLATHAGPGGFNDDPDMLLVGALGPFVGGCWRLQPAPRLHGVLCMPQCKARAVPAGWA